MTVKRHNPEAGLTLIEIAVATVILLIVILGASAFRYNAALGARKADLRAAAGRTALLLCEGWRAVSDANGFDPTQLVSNSNCRLVIEASTEGPGVPLGFTGLGSYVIVADGVSCYATLSWKYVSPGSGLRVLNVDVAWEQRSSGTDGFTNADRRFRLITYAEN